MRTFIKAKFKKNPLSMDPNDFYAQVVLSGKFGVLEIIDAVLAENTSVNKDVAIEIISAFNKKIVELVVSGNQVNSGLVTVTPIIKGSLNNKMWNPLVNRVDANISQGLELSRALIETNIELQEEHGGIREVIDQTINITDKKLIEKNNSELDMLNINSQKEPPCGIAFRRWLHNS